MSSNYGAEMKVSFMPKCISFFVYFRIAVKSVILYQVEVNAPQVEPVGHFAFRHGACPETPHMFGCRSVPKYHTGYGRELSPHGRQIGRVAKRCFFHLRRDSILNKFLRRPLELDWRGGRPPAVRNTGQPTGVETVNLAVRFCCNKREVCSQD